MDIILGPLSIKSLILVDPVMAAGIFDEIIEVNINVVTLRDKNIMRAWIEAAYKGPGVKDDTLGGGVGIREVDNDPTGGHIILLGEGVIGWSRYYINYCRARAIKFY